MKNVSFVIIIFLFLLLANDVYASSTINADYNLKSYRNNSAGETNYVGSYSIPGVTNKVTGTTTSTYYLWGHVDGIGGCAGADGNIAKIEVTYTQNGFIRFEVGNTYINAGGGFDMGVTYINQLKYSYTNLSCLSVRVKKPSLYGCVTTTWKKSSLCPSSRWAGNTFIDSFYNSDSSLRGRSSGGDYVTYNSISNFVNSVTSHFKKITGGSGLSFSGTGFTTSDSNSNPLRREEIKSYICAINRPTYFEYGRFAYHLNDCNDYDTTNKLKWKSGTSVQTVYKMNLADSYMERLTGNVKYYLNNSQPIDTSKYIYEGKKFFIPLDYLDDKVRLSFRSSDFSSDRDINWKFNFDYNLDVLHNYYNVTKKSGRNVIDGYAFKYRTIALSNPFPNNISGNWSNYIRQDLYGDVNSSLGFSSSSETYLDENEQSYEEKDLKNYNLAGRQSDEKVSFTNNKKLQYESILTADEMTRIRNDNSSSVNRYLFNNTWLNYNGSSRFNVDYVETRDATFKKIGCGRYYNGIKGGGCP